MSILQPAASFDENELFNKIDRKKYRELINLFDERAKKFYHNPIHKFDKGFYLKPIEKIPIKVIQKEDYINLPKDIAFVVEEFRGYVLVVSSDLKKMYVSDNKDYTKYITVQIGEEIPVIKHYYLDKISSNNLTLLLGHLKPNDRFCRAFLEMYRITKNKKYLKPAKRILIYLIDRVNKDGRYRLPFPNVPLSYRAMYQSYLLQLLYDYNFLCQEKDDLIRSALMKLGHSFHFTDEGTRDHWLEATIGEVILDKLEIRRLNFQKLMDDLKILYEYIHRFEGKIPFCTKLCDPPQFTSNYQIYNTMLLVVLSAKYLRRDIKLDKIFPTIFNVFKKGAYWRLFRGLYYAKLQFGFDDPEWAEMWEQQIMKSESFFEIPTLLKYKILSEMKN